MGAQLLTRRARGIELTSAGRAFLEHARSALSQCEAATEAASRVAHPAKPCFSRGFLTGHELTWMPEALRILRDELPNIDVMISSQYSPQLADAILKGNVDAAFLTSNYAGVSNEVTGIYPLFQDIEISQSTLQSTTGAGIFLTGTKNVQIDGDQFTGCAAVPDADPIYSYFGSESKSALALSFAQNVSAIGDVAIGGPICIARADSSSSRDVVVSQ